MPTLKPFSRLRRRPPASLFSAIFTTLLLSFAGAAHAVPYIPTNGAQVVEHLPKRADPVQRELLRMRAALSANPLDIDKATALARRYIEQARVEGDPRYLGYAQAALTPWWKQPVPPDPVLVLRATLLQSTHHFKEALADLDLVLRHDSNNVQAWLTRATVQTVLGDFAAAKASCMRLYSRAPAVVVQTCLSGLGSVSGDARASYQQLKQALAARDDNDPGIRIWVVTLLAEMATRLGADAEAEAWFREALAFDDADSYLLAAYADFLIDHKRSPEVVRLLKDKTRVDSLLLRYAIALKASGGADAAKQADALRTRFDAAILRADTVHQREQARFELVLRNDPAAAVRLAKLNWAVQKEPADLRILAETAAASGDAEATRLVRAWLQTSHIEDVTLAPLLTKLKAAA
jgi:Tfp pilus assembly protein PilF